MENLFQYLFLLLRRAALYVKILNFLKNINIFINILETVSKTDWIHV